MRFKKLFLSMTFISTLIFSSSCSIFGSETSGASIERVESSTDENGTTIVTMYFEDEDMEPLTFEIPKGEKGEVGAVGAVGPGIASITSSESADGTKTILTITFTSPDMPTQTFEVNNGVSVKRVYTEYDPDTKTNSLKFEMSDGSILPKEDEKPIVIKDGVDGVGIKEVKQEQLPNGDYVITISYTDESMEDSVITLPYKNGEDGKDGKGINSIITNQIDNLFYISIQYSDGSIEDLNPIVLPQATKWLSGLGAPNSLIENQAIEGDYYFDQENYIIYFYDGSDFIEVINLTENNKVTNKYTVTFDPNGGGFISETIGKIQVDAGSTINLASIPLCSKDGFTFAGYYTTKEGPLNPLSGKLTDLTPIYRDTVFYAYYEVI